MANKNQVATHDAKAVGASSVKTGLEARLQPTGMKHIAYFDIQDDGRLREVAIVKLDRDKSGVIRSVYYIDVALLDQVDKGRLKAVVTNQHTDKYELWDLLAQNTLSNGKNALDYFHQLTRVVHGVGAVNTGMDGGLMGAKAEGSGIIGSEFSDPTSATLDA
jgi:hypothetical protein